MFFHMGKDIMVSSEDIVMILDYKKTKGSPYSQNFFSKINKEGLIELSGINDQDIKTVVITRNKTLFSPIAPSTIEKRIKKNKY